MSEVAQTACQEAVLGFCHAINSWETARAILSRIENDQFVSGLQREAVEGITMTAHLGQHRKIFERYVIPRNRRHGSNPGEPTSWSAEGSFFDVSPDTIESVEFPSSNRAEVIVDWGYQLPGGKTMFVLKTEEGEWRIDSLKVSHQGNWENALL